MQGVGNTTSDVDRGTNLSRCGIAIGDGGSSTYRILVKVGLELKRRNAVQSESRIGAKARNSCVFW